MPDVQQYNLYSGRIAINIYDGHIAIHVTGVLQYLNGGHNHT